MNLTNTAISKAEPGQTLKDNQVPGLHCRIFEQRRSFYLYYRTKGGRERRPKLGDLGVLTVPQAREIARDMLREVAAGKDPVADRKRSRGEMTGQELFDATFKAHWDKPRFHKSGHARGVKYLWNNHLEPRFAGKRLSEITRGEIRQLKRDMEDKPTAFNRCLAVLSRMFTWAEEEEIRQQGSNPCSLVEGYPAGRRKRYAGPEELKALGKILMRDLASNPRPVAFLLVLIASGARPRSIEQATFDQLKRVTVNEQECGIITFHGKTTSETGDEEQVFLPPLAMRAIDAVPRDQDDNRLIGMNAPRKYWEGIRKEAGCPDLWMRDLRRTFAVVGMSNGMGADVIGELLNHKSAQTTKIYALLASEARASVSTGIAQQMEGLIGSVDS